MDSRRIQENPSDPSGKSIAVSDDGIIWSVSSSEYVFSECYGISGNSRIGARVLDSQLITSDLDIVADKYYNNGFSKFSANIKYS